MSSAGLAALPAVPAALASQGIGLRAETSTDRAFLLELFIQTRWEELQPAPWPPEQKIAFLTQQFGFQDVHYTRHYDGAARGILLENDTPIGRLYLYSMPQELRIVDIALLPAHRSRGIGAALLTAVLDRAEAGSAVVTIHVEAFNRARNLYQRLGFVDIGGDGVYRKMQWPAAAAARDPAPQLKTAS